MLDAVFEATTGDDKRKPMLWAWPAKDSIGRYCSVQEHYQHNRKFDLVTSWKDEEITRGAELNLQVLQLVGSDGEMPRSLEDGIVRHRDFKQLLGEHAKQGIRALEFRDYANVSERQLSTLPYQVRWVNVSCPRPLPPREPWLPGRLTALPS